MSAYDDAAKLEALFPRVITSLFYSSEEDPLRHHSVGQIRLMRALAEGSKAASDLSHRLGLSPSSLTQMASRMITAGLVSKELDHQDRRVRKLSLTPAGRELMDGRTSTRAKHAAEILQRMDQKQVQQLIQILEEIAENPSKSGGSHLEATV